MRPVSAWTYHTKIYRVALLKHFLTNFTQQRTPSKMRTPSKAEWNKRWIESVKKRGARGLLPKTNRIPKYLQRWLWGRDLWRTMSTFTRWCMTFRASLRVPSTLGLAYSKMMSTLGIETRAVDTTNSSISCVRITSHSNRSRRNQSSNYLQSVRLSPSCVVTLRTRRNRREKIRLLLHLHRKRHPSRCARDITRGIWCRVRAVNLLNRLRRSQRCSMTLQRMIWKTALQRRRMPQGRTLGCLPRGSRWRSSPSTARYMMPHNKKGSAKRSAPLSTTNSRELVRWLQVPRANCPKSKAQGATNPTK